MDILGKLSRDTQIVLGGTVLYLVFSFFDWQQVSAFGVSAGNSEWSGIGVLAGLLAVAVIAWEALRVVQPAFKPGPLAPGLVSIGLVLLLLVFTVITFLTHNEFRHWPSWLGLVLSVVIAAAAGRRSRTEGVDMSDLSSLRKPTQH